MYREEQSTWNKGFVSQVIEHLLHSLKMFTRQATNGHRGSSWASGLPRASGAPGTCVGGSNRQVL